MLLMGGIVPYAFFFLQPDLRPDLGPGLVVGIFVIAFAVFYFVLARRLRQFRPWARTVTVVISCIGLLGVPLGTIVNGAFLYVLIKGKHLFPPDLRTPPIQTDTKG